MADLKGKTDAALVKALNDKREALRKFRFSISGSKTRDVKEGRNARKEIAQILTELQSRKEK